MSKIAFCKGYKYQIAKDYLVQTRVFPAHLIQSAWVDLSVDGMLLIKKGFASDGPSATTVDTTTFLRGAFIHDGFYYLIKQGKLGFSFRKAADKELYRIILEDGMNKIRAWYVYKAVRWFGKSAAEDKKKIYTAP